MKKKSMQLAIQVSQITKLKRHSRNIFQFINKIPLETSQLYQQSPIDIHLSDQMKYYPIPKYIPSQINHSSSSSNNFNYYANQQQRKKKQLSLFLHRVNKNQFDFLALQETKSFIDELSPEQFQAMKLIINKFKTIVQEIESSNKESYVKKLASNIIQQLNAKDSKKYLSLI